MKGACDGGLHIPHSNKRFPGFTKGEDGAEDSYNPEVHRSRIYGLHVAEYMRTLKEEDPERYQSQFSAYIRNKVDADSIEKMYQEAFQKIRANPDPVKKEAREVKRVRQGAMIKTAKSQYVRNVKLDKETRKARVLKKVRRVHLTWIAGGSGMSAVVCCLHVGLCTRKPCVCCHANLQIQMVAEKMAEDE